MACQLGILRIGILRINFRYCTVPPCTIAFWNKSGIAANRGVHTRGYSAVWLRMASLQSLPGASKPPNSLVDIKGCHSYKTRGGHRGLSIEAGSACVHV